MASTPAHARRTARTRRGALHVAVLLGTLATRPAWAQSTPTARERALATFHAGERCYSEGHFACAAVHFHEAYETFAEPVLLFNLARACEDLGDLPQAAAAYEAFLQAAADVPDRGAVRARIESLRDLRQRTGELARAVAAYRAYRDRERTGEPSGEQDSGSAAWLEGRIATLSKLQSELRPRAPAEPAPRHPSPLPWIVAGAGVTAVGVGLGIGIAAQSRHDDAVAEPKVSAAGDLQSDAERLASVANVVLVAGAVVAVAGAVWGIVDLRAHPSTPGSPRSARTGLSIGW